MSRRTRFIVAGVVLAALLASLLSPAGRMVIGGWVRGEAFYKWRPTSYWRTDVKESVQQLFKDAIDGDMMHPQSSPSALQRVCDRLEDCWWGISHSPLPDGRDPAAVPVLRQLLEDKDPLVRDYAARALDAGGAQ